MNTKGQSALEYLMTYGWALIVIAIVIGVLIFVTSSSTGGVTCQSRGTQLVLREWTINTGTSGVGLVLQNATGGTITWVNAVSAGAFDAETCDAAAVIAGTCSITPGTPFQVTPGNNLVVQSLSGPASAGSFGDGTVDIAFTTAGGLSATVQVICSGAL